MAHKLLLAGSCASGWLLWACWGSAGDVPQIRIVYPDRFGIRSWGA